MFSNAAFEPTKMCVRGRAPMSPSIEPAGTCMNSGSWDSAGTTEPQRRQNGRSNTPVAR